MGKYRVRTEGDVTRHESDAGRRYTNSAAACAVFGFSVSCISYGFGELRLSHRVFLSPESSSIISVAYVLFCAGATLLIARQILHREEYEIWIRSRLMKIIVILYFLTWVGGVPAVHHANDAAGMNVHQSYKSAVFSSVPLCPFVIVTRHGYTTSGLSGWSGVDWDFWGVFFVKRIFRKTTAMA